FGQGARAGGVPEERVTDLACNRGATMTSIGSPLPDARHASIGAQLRRTSLNRPLRGRSVPTPLHPAPLAGVDFKLAHEEVSNGATRSTTAQATSRFSRRVRG